MFQMYAFVYQRLIDFPQGKFDYETVTTLNVFESVHKIINFKMHLHHSHVPGKIIGYAHDFCNMKVRKKQNQFTRIVHNLHILLLGIIENRFQAMHDKSLMYNPRKCNSASKLSGCIQREQSKVILALPMNNSVMEVFEKTLTGGFNCVNTRLSFDTELQCRI